MSDSIIMGDTWKTAVESYIKDEEVEHLSDVASALVSNSVKLLQVVEGLGMYLTDSDTSIRARGTKFLAELMHQLPGELLSGKEVDVMCTFFTDRLKDHHSVSPHVLNGMLAMSRATALSPEGMAKMLRCIFAEVHLQTLAHGDRRLFYEMCDYLLLHRLKDVQERGAEFVCGFVQCMDGEKDPRNLTIAFRCVHSIAKHLPLDVFLEELFEVVSCYFPIEFTPSPNDPGAVTKDDLVTGLRQCLVASPKFAEFCLPLLLEKLTSSVQSSKIDALQTLNEGTLAFGPNHIKEYMSSFWAAIRREVFSGSSDSVVEASLAALAGITKCLSAEVTPAHGTSLLEDFIMDVFTDTKRYLSDPDQQFMVPSVRLMESAAKGSDLACCKVIALVIPVLLETFNMHSQANQRRPVLEALLVFINIGKTTSSEEAQPLGQYKEQLYAIYLGLMGTETNYLLRSLAVKGIMGLVSTKWILSQEEIGVVSDHLSNLALHDVNEMVAQESNIGLIYTASQHPLIIQNHILQDLTAKMESGETGAKLLRTVACISAHSSIAKLTIPLLLNNLQKSCSEEAASVICQNLYSVVETSVNLEDMTEFFVRDFFPGCTKLLVIATVGSDPSVLNNISVIQSLSDCLRIIVQSLDVPSGQTIADSTIRIFRDGDLSGILKESGDCLPVEWMPLEIGCSTSQSQLLPYFSAIVCSLDRKVTLNNQKDILDKMFQLATDFNTPENRLAAAKCFAALVNKMDLSSDLDHVLDTFKTRLLSSIMDTGLSIENRNMSVSKWTWLVKALVLKSHPQQMQWTDTLVQWFSISDIAQTAADGLYIILNEFEDVMTSAMHADIKIMYRQRFFTYALPKVVAAYRNLEPEKRSYCLTALSYLLRFVPKQVLAVELPSLIPLLMQSLQCEVPSLWLSTLDTLYDLVHDAPEALAKHLDSLVPQLIRFSQYKLDMKVRLSALQCLGMLTTLAHHVVLPYRTTVTRALAVCLDDHKRLVRKEAAKARGEWFLMGAPGS